MRQYKNQYSTVFAVRKKAGKPRLMCRVEEGRSWVISGVLASRTGDAKTEEELQAVLDRTAEELGWTEYIEPASAEPPEIVDESSEPDGGFPDWVRPMVEAFLKFSFFRELPEFTANAIRHSDPVKHYQGGSFADGLYDTSPKGIRFTAIRGEHREARYTWNDFVRRCNAEGLESHPIHKGKENAPCNTKTPAPTGAAAATTGASAARKPSQEEETSTTSESGEDASTSTSATSSQTAETSTLAPGSPAAAAPVTPVQSDAETASSGAEFDYSGLDNQTVNDLHLAEREYSSGKRMAEMGLRRMADAVAIAHEVLVANCDKRNNQHSDDAFRRWCSAIGITKDTAYRLLQVSNLFDRSTPREQRLLEELSPSLLYAAAKPSAPPELVDAVKSGDITSHKQYKDLLTRYNAEHAAREQAEQERDEAATHIQAARDMQIDTARERDAALKEKAALARDCNRLGLEAEKARKDRDEAIKQRDAENTELKAKLRELESRPVEVAVAQPGDAQIEAWRKEGEERAAAALQDSIRKANQAKADAQRQVADLQNQLSAARPDADTCQRTVDTLYETTENLRLLLRTQLRQAQLTPADYSNVVAHVLQAADALRDTVRSCAPAGYDFDSEDDDDFE